MFLAHRKGLALDGRRPTLLTGYGGFNVSELPAFSSRAADLTRGVPGVKAVRNELAQKS